MFLGTKSLFARKLNARCYYVSDSIITGKFSTSFIEKKTLSEKKCKYELLRRPELLLNENSTYCHDSSILNPGFMSSDERNTSISFGELPQKNKVTSDQRFKQ